MLDKGFERRKGPYAQYKRMSSKANNQANPMITKYPDVDPFFTTRWIVGQAEQAARDPQVFYLARSIVREVRERDKISEALAIKDWIERSIRFTQDPRGIELVFGPFELIKLIKRYGRWSEDCESIVGLTYSLLRSIGHVVRFVIADFGRYPYPFPEHIFCQDLIDGQWYTVDGAEKDRTSLMLHDIKQIWTFGPF